MSWTQVKRGAELCTDHHLSGWKSNLIRPGKPQGLSRMLSLGNTGCKEPSGPKDYKEQPWRLLFSTKMFLRDHLAPQEVEAGNTSTSKDGTLLTSTDNVI